MGFRTGRVSYARFAVTGGPDAVSADVLEALAGGQIRIANVGAPSEVEAGWVAGRHVFDADFAEDVVVFGDVLLFGLRLDTNRVPAEIRTAYRAMAEAARRRESPTGLVGRQERREAREEAEEKLREELSSGRYRRSALVPVLWDVRRKLVLAPAAGETKRAALDGMFGETFDATLQPRTSGSMAYAAMAARGRTRDYEDLSPSPFTAPPPGAHDDEESGRDVEVPAVPWVHVGPEPKDFVGNEFLMWLWARQVRGEALIETGRGPVGVVIERLLETECAWAVSGRQSLRAETPTRWSEARSAFRNGKWARKAGLTVAADGAQWELTFQADRFVVSSARLPDPDDPPESERQLIEHRLESMVALDDALTALFATFLEARTGSGWSSRREQIAEVLGRRSSRRKAAASVEIVTRPAEAAITSGGAG